MKPMSEESVRRIERAFEQTNDPPFKNRSNSVVILKLCAEIRRSWEELREAKEKIDCGEEYEMDCKLGGDPDLCNAHLIRAAADSLRAKVESQSQVEAMRGAARMAVTAAELYQQSGKSMGLALDSLEDLLQAVELLEKALAGSGEENPTPRKPTAKEWGEIMNTPIQNAKWPKETK